MKFLLPFALFALLSIVILIIIYIIRPNYQQKVVSSTYVWKLSLKYKKKRIPTSVLRNIVIILCQVIILACCALALARPVFVRQNASNVNEVIAIIDSSASMLTKSDGKTRFERAVEKATERVDETLTAGGYASVIIADGEPYYLFEHLDSTGKSQADEELAKLISGSDTACSYGVSDSEAAIAMCEDITEQNASAMIYLYTDEEYENIPEDLPVSVELIREDSEWNAAILDVEAELVDNYYSVTVSVACYNKDADLPLTVEVYGANADDNSDGDNFTFTTTATCSDDGTVKVVFRSADNPLEEYEKNAGVVYYGIPCDTGNDRRFYSFERIFVYFTLGSEDSLSVDNSFTVYGGIKPVLKVQYTSLRINPFMSGGLSVLQSYLSDTWDIRIKEVKVDNSETPEETGYDLYIYEHYVPSVLPTDGVIVVLDPCNSGNLDGYSNVVSTLGLVYGGTQNYSSSEGVEKIVDSSLLNNIDTDDITLTRISILSSYTNYNVLMTCNGYPAVLLRETAAEGELAQKILVLPFSVHYSNLGNSQNLPILLLNIFNYFFPATADSSVYEVGESAQLNGRGASLTVYDSVGEKHEYNTVPVTFTFDMPGVYTVEQSTYFKPQVTETFSIFVKMPSTESNIIASKDTIEIAISRSTQGDYMDDLIIYFAAAALLLLFVEWLLQLKDNG